MRCWKCERTDVVSFLRRMADDIGDDREFSEIDALLAKVCDVVAKSIEDGDHQMPVGLVEPFAPICEACVKSDAAQASVVAELEAMHRGPPMSDEDAAKLREFMERPPDPVKHPPGIRHYTVEVDESHIPAGQLPNIDIPAVDPNPDFNIYNALRGRTHYDWMIHRGASGVMIATCKPLGIIVEADTIEELLPTATEAFLLLMDKETP